MTIMKKQKKLTLRIPVELLAAVMMKEHHNIHLKFFRRDAILQYCAQRKLMHKDVANWPLKHGQKYFNVSVNVCNNSSLIPMSNMERVGTYFAALVLMRHLWAKMMNTYSSEVNWPIDSAIY